VTWRAISAKNQGKLETLDPISNSGPIHESRTSFGKTQIDDARTSETKIAWCEPEKSLSASSLLFLTPAKEA
jgi:hypothetical protein